MKKYSQAYQDLFALKVVKEKRDGSFIEIGSNDPIFNNNTYLMESRYNWKGLMIEYEKVFEEPYKIFRSKSIHLLEDATKVDYRKIMDKNNFPCNIDYLQIDLDVDNRSTLNTFLLLNETVFDKYKFASITFEHDIYRGNYYDTQEISRQILKERGYILVFPNVQVVWDGRYREFEDWYVHPDLVDMEYINRIKTDNSLKCDEIALLL